ncbi:MAG: DUF2975 domain-containing protein [Bacteroidota bacterium]
MISSILSRLFLWGFILCTLGGIGHIVSQVIQRPIRIAIGSSGSWTFGEPGILVDAFATGRDRAAPDTTVKFSITDSLGGLIQSGSYSKPGTAKKFETELDESISKAKKENGRYQLDTQITIIGDQFYGGFDTSRNGAHSFTKLEDGRVICKQLTQSGGHAKVQREDTFHNMAAAERSIILGDKNALKYNISEVSSTSTQTLRILPTTGLQKWLFALYQLINFSSLSLMLFLLYKLFRRFSKDDFFDIKNVQALKFIGCCLLVPVITHITIYFTFLNQIHPQKLIVSFSEKDPATHSTSYNFSSTIDLTALFIAGILIVLSYIFNEAVQLKEDQDLTV